MNDREEKITESGVRDTAASAKAALKRVRVKITRGSEAQGSGSGCALPPASTELITTEQAIQALKACRKRGDTSRKLRRPEGGST